jgi:hypothetical protein
MDEAFPLGAVSNTPLPFFRFRVLDLISHALTEEAGEKLERAVPRCKKFLSSNFQLPLMFTIPLMKKTAFHEKVSEL